MKEKEDRHFGGLGKFRHCEEGEAVSTRQSSFLLASKRTGLPRPNAARPRNDGLFLFCREIELINYLMQSPKIQYLISGGCGLSVP